MSEVDLIWNDDVQPQQYVDEVREYRQAILEQYKLYVEMADRTSQRRSLTNTFFLGFNSAFIAAATSILAKHSVNAGWLLPPLVALLVQCVIWFAAVRSYRMLNSRKYRIIGTLEQRLPATPWLTEWRTLGQGAGITRYWRLTLLEQWVPIIFGLAYVSSYCIYLSR